MQEAGKGCKKQKLGGDIALLHRKVRNLSGRAGHGRQC